MEPNNGPSRRRPDEMPPKTVPEVTENPLDTASGLARGTGSDPARRLESEIAALVDELRAQPRAPGTRAVIPPDFFDRVDAVFARHRSLPDLPDECFQDLAGVFDFADLHPDLTAQLDAMPPLSPDFASRIVSAIRHRQSNGRAQDGWRKDFAKNSDRR